MDLQPFCSVDEMRASLMTPWVFNGWQYATDGRICIRIKTDEMDDSNNPFKRPDASMLFKDFNVEGLESFEIPELDGVKVIECEDCDGDGCAICDMGHEHECPECGGDGHYEEWPKQEIGGRVFSERFLSKMTALPGLKFFPSVTTWDEGKPAHPAFFTFDNGQGLLMPIRKGEA